MPVPELSQTEERIVLLVAQGRSRPEIAAVVGLDERTVDWHLAQANRPALARPAARAVAVVLRHVSLARDCQRAPEGTSEILRTSGPVLEEHTRRVRPRR